jgi:hypothetical protein
MKGRGVRYYKIHLDEILGYTPLSVADRNGHDPRVLFDIQMVAYALKQWTVETSVRTLRANQCTERGVIVRNGFVYPVELLEKLDQFHEQFPSYFTN